MSRLQLLCVQGFGFSILLSITGLNFFDWRWWLLAMGFAVLSNLPEKDRA